MTPPTLYMVELSIVVMLGLCPNIIMWSPNHPLDLQATGDSWSLQGQGRELFLFQTTYQQQPLHAAPRHVSPRINDVNIFNQMNSLVHCSDDIPIHLSELLVGSKPMLVAVSSMMAMKSDFPGIYQHYHN